MLPVILLIKEGFFEPEISIFINTATPAGLLADLKINNPR